MGEILTEPIKAEKTTANTSMMRSRLIQTYLIEWCRCMKALNFEYSIKDNSSLTLY
jgi:hypothetical protein